MKFLLLSFVLIISVTLPAQNSDAASRAKTFVDKFWKIVDDIKKKETENSANKIAALKMLADNAMTQIGYIKKRDPNYDVKPLEEVVRPYIDAQKTQVQQHNEQARAAGQHADKTGDGCGGLFMGHTNVEMRGTGNVNADLANHIEQLKAYNEKVNRILSTNMMGVEVCESYLRGFTNAAKDELKRLMKDALRDDASTVQFAYREIVGREAFWNAAKRIYPTMTEAADVHKAVKDAIASLGSMDDALATANKKKQERLKNTFMPKAVLINAAIEAEFKEAFVNEGWGEAIIKINILSREWNIIRNDLTGAIICRTQTAAIVAKQKAGNCMLYEYSIKQQYNGSGYSAISSRYAHGVLENEFICDNAK